MRQECEAGSMGVRVRFSGPGSRRPDCRCALIQQKHEEKQPFAADRRHINILLHKSNMTVLILGFSVRSQNGKKICRRAFWSDSWVFWPTGSKPEHFSHSVPEGLIQAADGNTPVAGLHGNGLFRLRPQTSRYNKISMNTSVWLAYLLYFN